MQKLKYKVIAASTLETFENGLNSFIENNEVSAIQYSIHNGNYTALLEYKPVMPSDKTHQKDYNPFFWYPQPKKY